MARNLDQTYAFDHPALTASLQAQRRKVGIVARNAFRVLYIVFIGTGLGIVFSEL